MKTALRNESNNNSLAGIKTKLTVSFIVQLHHFFYLSFFSQNLTEKVWQNPNILKKSFINLFMSTSLPLICITLFISVSGYLNELYEEVVTLRLANKSYKKAKAVQAEYRNTVPETLSTTSGPVNKGEVVAKQQRRLNFRPCD